MKQNNATNKGYVSPRIEILEIMIEQTILQGSGFDVNGGDNPFGDGWNDEEEL